MKFRKFQNLTNPSDFQIIFERLITSNKSPNIPNPHYNVIITL